MIEFFVDGHAVGKLGAAFSISMRSGRHLWRRSMKLGKTTSNFAELKAFEYCLKSIKPNFHHEELVIRSSGQYCPMILERVDGKWTKVPKVNIELVGEIRLLLEKFPKSSIRFEPDDKVVVELRKMTEDVVRGSDEVFTRI